MKKAFLYLFVALVLLASLCVVPAMATEETQNVHADHCVCGGTLSDAVKTAGGHTCEDITWEAWGDDEAEKDALPTSGNYYLVADMNLSSTSATGQAISAGNTVNLCLNGHSITTKGRTFDLYGTLNLSDCQGTGVVYSNTETKTTTTASVFFLRAGGAMSLYGGDLRAMNQTQLTQNSGAGYVSAKSTTKAASVFNMYGGSISGGNAKLNGGNIYNAGTFKLYGGTVSGGCAGIGGNIYSKTQLDIYGGTVSGGTATGNGGNIYTETGKNVNFNGGTVENGNAVDGGNIYAGGTYTMTGGAVSGGTATGNGGNIFGLRSVKINGGQVVGGSAVYGGNIYAMRYYAETTTTDDVAGTTTVVNTAKDLWIDAKGGDILDGTASKDGGNIYTDGIVTMTKGSVSGGTATGNGGNMFITNAKTTTTVTNAEGVATSSTETVKGKLSVSGGTISNGYATTQGGNLYLMGVELTFSGGTISGGKAKTNGGNIAFAGSSEATIKGTAVIEGGSANGGGNLFIGVATVTVEGDAIIRNGWSNLRGGNIRVDNAKSVLNIKGGQILDGGKNAEGAVTSTYGGNIVVYHGKVNMTGGTISGGAAKDYGGNIAVENDGVLTVTGGTISGGTASTGGSIALLSSKKATLSNMTISGGNAVNNGGNIFAHIKDVSIAVDLTDVTLENGVAGNDGGNLFFEEGNLTVTGGTITGGSANGGANILVNYKAVMTMDGTTVENGAAAARGGNIRLNRDSSATITNAAISGGSASFGGNLSMMHDSTATIENTTFTDGTAAESGGNIAVERQTSLTLTDCTVTGGTVPADSDETGFGGSIYVSETANLTITGGTVTGGTARFGGALAACSTGTVSVDGTAITSGKGNNGTAIYVAPGCGLALKDTTVTGSGTGTTVWSRGVITMVGTVEMPNEFFDLMVDCRYGESYLDVAALTSTGETPITVRRWAIDTTDDDCGLIAVNATEESLALFAAWKSDNYKVAYENGALVLTSAHNVQSLDANGKLVGGYATLTEAMADAGVQYVLYATLDAQEISKSILLDLNGNSLTNVTISADANVQLMDSATDDFTGEYGLLSGTIDGTVAAPEAGKSYLVVCVDGAWSAHCYEVALTHVSLKADNDALGYKAALYGDQVVQDNVVQFGFHLWVGDNAKNTYYKTGVNSISLRLQNIMKNNGGEMSVNANAFVVFTGGQEETTADYSTSMKQTVLAVNGIWETLTDVQKASVKGLYDAYATVMDAWFDENTTNLIKAWAPATEA